MSTHESIKELVSAYEVENAKFEKGNSAAGTRARKALAELSKALKARRNEITAEKASRKEAKEKAKEVPKEKVKEVLKEKAKEVSKEKPKSK